MNKVCYLLRSVPGAGKSTLAEYLAGGDSNVICCADDFFMVNGKYQFNPKQLSIAHRVCKNKFKKLVDADAPVIVQSNTNTALREFKEYKEYAEAAGYIVFVLVVENRHGGVNTHGVSEEVLDTMEKRVVGSLQLR